MNSNSSSESDLQPVRHVAGNNICVDCGEPSKLYTFVFCNISNRLGCKIFCS